MNNKPKLRPLKYTHFPCGQVHIFHIPEGSKSETVHKYCEKCDGFIFHTFKIPQQDKEG